MGVVAVNVIRVALQSENFVLSVFNHLGKDQIFVRLQHRAFRLYANRTYRVFVIHGLIAVGGCGIDEEMELRHFGGAAEKFRKPILKDTDFAPSSRDDVAHVRPHRDGARIAASGEQSVRAVGFEEYLAARCIGRKALDCKRDAVDFRQVYLFGKYAEIDPAAVLFGIDDKRISVVAVRHALAA